MSHATESVAIDPTLHHDLRKMAGSHPAAQLATSPLAKALAADIAEGGQITNSALTAYAAAIEQAALPSVHETDRQSLITRIKEAFPGR